MKIYRPTLEEWNSKGFWRDLRGQTVLTFPDKGKSDAEMEAVVECGKLHDDEFTSTSSLLKVIVVNPGGAFLPLGRISLGGMMPPDPKCVARKAKSIKIRSQLQEAGFVS